MINVFVGLGIGIVVLAVVLGIGTVVLAVLGNQLGASSATANTTVVYLQTQLGSSGLAGWVPIVVVAAAGFGILGYFVAQQGLKQGRY